ncbi:hypothetical protein BOW57_12500 [Flavobacterium sp. YO64]|nr:hypothetical protein BOW57_12500 [Flavobacterium sp. YO64]
MSIREIRGEKKNIKKGLKYLRPFAFNKCCNYFLEQHFLSFLSSAFLEQDSFLAFSFFGAGFVSCACAPIVNKAIAKRVNNFFIFCVI